MVSVHLALGRQPKLGETQKIDRNPVLTSTTSAKIGKSAIKGFSRAPVQNRERCIAKEAHVRCRGHYSAFSLQETADSAEYE